MSARRTVSTGRSLTFISALLLSTAIAAPAFAQVEEVVVTAQKRAEDVQTVPIAISAFSGDDLKAHQISQFKDLQFNAPNTTYTAGNFGGADFQIRGIGITAVGYDSESGVAINQNEVYLSNPQITEGSFYDLSDLEVLAGPQSTLYGRGATGGAINVNFAKPDLETFGGNVIASYGNYNAMTATAVLNMPIITDELGIRIAGNWYKRDGFVENIFNDSKTDGRDDYSFRGSARWQPTSRTTIDFSGQFSREDDSHMRADKQLCTSDPTGVLGCLPNSAGTQPVNPFSTLSVIASSQQGLAAALGSPALGSVLGLFNLASAPTLPPGFVDPSGARQINTDFNPHYQSQDNFMSGKWDQEITSWLKADLIGGYDHNSYTSQESYNNIPGDPLPSNTAGFPANCGAAAAGSPNVQCAATEFLGTLSALAGPAYAANYAPYFANAMGANPQLPISSTHNLGIIGGDYRFTGNNEGFDQSDGSSSQYSGELRFTTSFTGPLNAMVGGYYLHTHVQGDYFVNATTLDYPGIVLGAFSGLATPAAQSLCLATGCILGPSFYHNDGETDTLTSKSVYGELYYDIVPDTFKLVGGLRYTDDQKFQQGRIELYDGLIPIGTTDEDAADAATRCPSKPCATPIFDTTNQDFTNLSGHLTANWTPKLDFTDQTLVYASYSRGYKAGGANPGIEAGFGPGLLVPATYGPEIINAYEVGTKNQVLGNSLQINGDVYYYDYKGLQVSSIEDNTSVNQNIDAKIWGEEGNLLWVPSDRWQFGVNVAAEQMDVEGQEVDPRNPTGGDPHTLLVKDDTISADTGSNCVLYYTGAFPGLPAGFTAPAAGVHSLASQGIANAAFGSCSITAAAAKAAGYTLTDPSNPNNTLGGVLTNLNGNELQNTPSFSISLNGQYTQPLSHDYNLVARVDYHWQTHMWARIFEDGADYIKSGDTMNASLQLNSLNGGWYAQGFIKNIFNKNNVTGEYLTSSTSGLYTNAFYGDPRTYGLEVGIKF